MARKARAPKTRKAPKPPTGKTRNKKAPSIPTQKQVLKTVYGGKK